jgi:hypothetical protein
MVSAAMEMRTLGSNGFTLVSHARDITRLILAAAGR